MKTDLRKKINDLNGYLEHRPTNQAIHNELANLYIADNNLIKAGRHLYLKQDKNETEKRCVAAFEKRYGGCPVLIAKQLIAKYHYRLSELDKYSKQQYSSLIQQSKVKFGFVPKFLLAMQRYLDKEQKIMNNEATIKQFYQAFSENNIDKMLECYHDEIVFEDPAFGRLEGEHAKNMWRMLLIRSGDTMQISYKNVEADVQKGRAEWTAIYEYGTKKRKVVNNIQANFEFKDGKIIKHTDDFDLWKWAQQALGLSGYLLGWSSFMKGKIQQQTNGLLRKFEEKL